MNLGSLMYQIGADTSQLRNAARDVENFTRQMDGGMSRLRDGVGRVTSSFFTLKSAIVGVVAGATVRELLNTATALDTMNTKLQYASGAAVEAARDFEFVRQQSEKLGLNLMTSAEAFSSFSAAARGTAMEGKGVRDVWLALAEASTVMNLSADQAQGAMIALTQMMSKGKVQMEELRGQLGERIPGAFQIAARAMDMSTAQLDKFMSEGKLLSEDFLPKFAAQLRKEMAGSAEESSKNLLSAINRMKNAWLDMQKSILDAGVGDLLKEAIVSLGQGMRSMADSLKEHEATVRAVISTVRELASAVGELWNLFLTIPTGILSFFQDYIKNVEEARKQVKGLGEDTNATITASMQNWNTLTSFMADWGRNFVYIFTFMLQSIGEVFSAMAVQAKETFAVIYNLGVEAARGIGDSFYYLGSLIGNALSFNFAGVQADWAAMGESVRGTAGKMGQVVGDYTTRMRASGDALVKTLADGFGQMRSNVLQIPALVEPTAAAVRKARGELLSFNSAADAIGSTTDFLSTSMDKAGDSVEKAGKKAKQSKKDFEDLDQFFRQFDESVQDMKDKLAELQGAFDPEQTKIAQWGEGLKKAFEDGISKLAISIVELEQKLAKVQVVDPTILKQIEEEKTKLQALKDVQQEYNQTVDETVKAKQRLQQINEQLNIAEQEAQYAALTGTIQQQLAVQQKIIDLKIEQLRYQRDVTHEISAEAAAIQQNILKYQQYQNQLRATGSLLDGLKEGFTRIAKEQGTVFDIGLDLSQELYGALGKVFDSIMDGFRNIEDAAEGMKDAVLAALAKIAVQQVIVPVVFQMFGLNQVLSTIGGLNNSILGGGGSGSGGGFGLNNIFGGGSGNFISGLWNTPMFGGGAGSSGSPGLLNSGNYGAGMPSSGGFTWGNAFTVGGGLLSMGMGAYGLANGNYIGGASGILGGGMMALSPFLGSVLGPIGAAISVLGSLLGGMFSTSDPGIRLNAGKSYGNDLFNIKYTDVDVSDSEKSQIEAGVQAWFDAWTTEFGVVWADVFASVPYDFHASLDSSDLEEVKNMAARWGDDMLRELGGYLADNIFGSFIPGSDAFIKGLTGMGDLRGMGEGELTALIASMFQPLYALQQAGVQVGQMFLDLRAYFGGAGATNADAEAAQNALGRWFKSLQNAGEEISATFLDLWAYFGGAGATNADAEAAQNALGRWFKSLQNAGEEISATVARVMTTLGTVPEGMDRLAALVESGMNLKEAYESLEKQLTVTQALVTELVQNMIITALQTLDFSQAKEAFMAGVKQMMINSVMGAFSQDILNSVVKAAFDPLGGLAGAIADAINAKDYSGLGDKFAAALDAIGPAIDELQPKFADLFEMIAKLGKAVEGAVPADPTGSNKITDAFNAAFSNKITDAFNAALAAGFRGASWEDTKNAFLGSLNDMLKEVLAQKWVANMETLFMDALTSATSSVFAGGLQGLMSAYFEGTITSDDFKKYISEFWEALGPVLDDMDDMEPKFKTFLEALGLIGDTAEETADIINNSLTEAIKSYTDIINQAAGGDYASRMRSLNDWLQEEVDKLNEMGLSAVDAARMQDLLTEAYRVQADTIRNDLLQAIYEAEQATRGWVYSLTQAIDELTGSANAGAIAFSAYEEALARSRDESLGIDNRIGAINDAKRYLDEYTNAQIASIQATHQATIDALNAQRQAISDNSQAEQDAIRELYEGRIDALQEQKDALSEQYDLQQEAIGEQIDALQEQLSLAQRWSSVLDSVHQQIMTMLQSTQNPADEFERLAIAQSEVKRLEALYKSSSGEQQAEYASQLQQAYADLMTAAGTAYPNVASPEYQKIYDQVLAGLQDIEDSAASRAADQDAIQQRILDLQEQSKVLDEQRNSALAAIDAQIDAERKSMKAAIKAAQASNDAALASIDAQIAAEQAAMQAEIEAFKASMVPYYQALLDEGQALYEQQVDNLQQQLSLLEQIRDAILIMVNSTVSDAGTIGDSSSSIPRNDTVGDSGRAGVIGDSGYVPGYASGTPYVPFDMLAYIHKGERIVPAAQNHQAQDRPISINYAPVFNVEGKVDEAALARISVRDFEAYIKHKGRSLIQRVASGRA